MNIKQLFRQDKVLNTHRTNQLELAFDPTEPEDEPNEFEYNEAEHNRAISNYVRH